MKQKFKIWLRAARPFSLPTALKNINSLHISNGSTSKLATLDQETAKLQGQFGVILIISILLSSIK